MHSDIKGTVLRYPKAVRRAFGDVLTKAAVSTFIDLSNFSCHLPNSFRVI